MRFTPLLRFAMLYAALYAAFGVASPFLPGFLKAHGMATQEVGVLLGAGTAVRMVTGPLAGRLADRRNALRGVLGICAAFAALIVLFYLPVHSFRALLLVSLAEAALLAPVAPLADALSLAAASPATGPGFQYGWVRGVGSGAFITGSVLGGQAAGWLGLEVIIWLNAILLGVAALCVIPVPKPGSLPPTRDLARGPPHGVLTLLKLPKFRRLLLVAALVLGSHAMHDAFAVIRWSTAGISASTSSLLWSESVVAEIVIFFVLGPALLSKVGSAGAAALAAAAGALRWAVMAVTTHVVAMAMVEPLHGFTFALLHLACMRLITELVPCDLQATAQTVYGTFAVGAATAVLTLASGWLYDHFGAHAFWAMAALCLATLPVTWGLRDHS
jgi:PPP family 3-phenylpropionic acid transporter